MVKTWSFLRGHPSTWKHFCMFCFVLVDRPHGSCKRTFFPLFRPCVRVWTVMMSSPLPSTSGLRPLNPATSHNNNNNNNGGLHACVRAAEDIEPIRAKYSAALSLRWAKKDYGRPTSNFRRLLVVFGFSFYCLFVYSMQASCACSVSSSLSLVKFKRQQ